VFGHHTSDFFILNVIIILKNKQKLINASMQIFNNINKNATV